MVVGRSISNSYVLNVDGMKITFTDEVTLLGVSIDNNLTFENHIVNYAEKHHTNFKPFAV